MTKITKYASGTVLHAVEVSDLKDVDTDNNVIEYEESFSVPYFKMCIHN